MKKKITNTITFLVVIFIAIILGRYYSLNRDNLTSNKENLFIGNNNSDKKYNKQIKEFWNFIEKAREENKNFKYKESNKTFYKAIDFLSEYAPKEKFDEFSSSIWQEIAENHSYLGNYDKAEKLLIDALKIKKKIFGLNDISVAITLHNLGSINLIQGNYKEAEKNYLKALKIKEKVLDKDNEEIFVTVFALNNLYSQLGNIKKAESNAKRAMNFANKNFNKNDPKVASVKNSLGLIYLRVGKYNLSQNLFLDALDILKKRFDENDPTILKVKSNLAKFYTLKGDYKKAENILVSNLEIIKKKNGNNNITTSEFQSLLADLYFEIDYYRKAEDLYLISFDTKKALLKPESRDLVMIRNRLGLLYSEQGKYKEAEEIYKEALLSYKTDSSNSEILISSVLNNLYVVLIKQGKLEEAKLQLLRSKKISEELLGKNNRAYITIINNLGYINERQLKYEKAQLFYKEALKISKNYLSENKFLISTILNNIGVNYTRQNLFLEAEPYLLEAYNIRKKILGNNHAETSQISINLAFIYYLISEENKIETYAYPGLRGIFNLIQKETQYLALNNREQFLESMRSSYMSPFQWALGSKSGARMALFSKINHQGLLQDIEKKQSQIARESISENSNLKEISKIVNQLSSKELSQEFRNNLAERKAILEKKLPSIKSEIVQIEQVSEVLPENSVLIEFQKYNQIIFKSKDEPVTIQSKYLALILKPNKEVISIDLGSSNILEKKVRETLFKIKQGSPLDSKVFKEISDLVIKPLYEAVGEKDVWFISLDGELNSLPFNLLSLPSSKKLLVEEIKIRSLTTGRDLIKLSETSKNSPNSSIVIANPDFDNKNKKFTSNTLTFPIEQKISLNLKDKLWKSLPGTKEEGEIISQITNAKLFARSEATTTKFKQYKSPKLIHIASHAFYIPNPKNYSYENPNLFRFQNDLNLLPKRFQSENPLLRSGIVLAGANNQSSNSKDDGYLTAMEIALLDWKDTELVVISGCETAKGDLIAGEGVYGLKRSINIAGAKSSILTLWKVDDIATRAFMENFYKNIKLGKTREDALLKTQKDFRLGLIKSPSLINSDWTKPYYWAAFTLTGDWKELDL